MRQYLLLSLLLASLILLNACQSNKLSAEALAIYVADPAHHLRQEQQVGSTEVSVTYQPTDLLVTHDLPGPLYRQSAVDSVRKKYNSETFFVLSIARNHREILQPIEGFSSYSDLLQTLAFRMDGHVRLLTSQGDTLLPVNYYLDRTYASTNATQILFAFPRLPTTGTWRFQLLECGLGTGNLSFLFDTLPVTVAPVLALD